MNSFNNKRPAYMYAKGFKLDKFLGNLQGYKIATGQVSKDEFRSVSERYGSDEGAVFGSLITNASGSSKDEGVKRQRPAKRKKQKRRRKLDTTEKEDETSESVLRQEISSPPLPLEEPLSIPAALLDYKDCGSSDEGDSKSDTKENSSATGSESDDADSSDVDFFGLSSKPENLKCGKTIKTSGESSNKKTSTVSHKNQERMHPHQSNLPEKQPEIWDQTKLKYKDQVSTLSSYKCWKCRRVGHLPEDCTVQTGLSAAGSAFDAKQARGHHSQQNKSKASFYSSSLKDYYKRCRELRESKDVKCSDCGVKSNLAYCFECGLTLCDGRGHLIDHLLEYPSHTKLYSFKLQRQIKCCKSTCDVVDATQLLMCSSCLDRAFTSHYSMINATWSRAGLKLIPNALACEQHFQWHRMNCASPTGEVLVTREKLETSRSRGDGLLSEFYF